MEDINKHKESKKEYGFSWPLFIITFLLVGLGLIMVYSATSVEASTDPIYNYNSYYFLFRQLRGVFLGLAGIFLIIRLRIEVLKKISFPFVLVSLFFLFLVLIIGVERNGARRWIEIAGFSFQPSELCKVSLVIFMASYISESKRRIKSFWKGVFPLLFIASFMFLLIEHQPDLGTILVIACTFMYMLWIGGAKVIHMAGITLSGVLIILVLIISKPYRFTRLMAFWNPWEDSQASGYHIIQSLLALGSGGLWGVGFGQSKQKLFYLPEHHTDFIFAIIGEELGFIGAVFTIFLFLVFTYIAFKIALSKKDSFLFLLGSGMTASIVFQAFINIGVASGSLPLTGVTLPFISFGSTSMMISLISVGIILKVSLCPPLLVSKKKEIPKINKTDNKIYKKRGLNL